MTRVAPLQLPLFPPESKWTPPKVSELPSWKDAKRVAIDIETCDPLITKLGPGVRRGGFVAGIAFAIEDGPSAYLPIAHGNGTNLPREHVLAYFREQARVFTGDLVGANLQYDLDYLWELGIVFNPRFHRDVQIAEPLLDELQHTYNLDDIATRWGLPGKDRTLLQMAATEFRIDPKQDMWKLPPEYVAIYAVQDVQLPLQLLRRQERRIDEEELWPIYDLESRLLPVLVRMRRRGVRISFDQLDKVERWSLAEETRVLEEVYQATEVRIKVGDVWKAEELAKPLIKIGVHVEKTSQGKSSITKEFLASVEHPVGKLLSEARRVNKIRTTFVESIRAHQVNGRVHPTFNQLRGSGEEDTGGRFGRLSSTDPNIQQQPARDPTIGPMWRGVYLPDEGLLWACCDISQQEPRWLTHYAELAQCAGAKEAADRYRTDPKTDNHQMMSDLTGLPRRPAKDLFLGKCYGMGGAKLCRALNLPTKWIQSNRTGKMVEVAGDEGQAIIDQFDRGVPYVKQLAWAVERRAQEVGFIKTVLGRRCRFPKISDGEGGFDWTHKALNRLIQGSSADQMKKAMVEADAAGIPLQLQVHDELDLSVARREDTDALAKIMSECAPCNVPMKVDVELGPDWGHIEK